MATSTFCSLANCLLSQEGTGLVLYCCGGSTVNCFTTALGFSAGNTADWSYCSGTDSGTAVVLRDDAKAAST